MLYSANVFSSQYTDTVFSSSFCFFSFLILFLNVGSEIFNIVKILFNKLNNIM